jgi:uncharacterized coiled-coil DUF342 family protein
MKLAEALSIRKSLSVKLVGLRDRLYNMVKVPEGDTPAEDPKELIDEIDKTCVRLEKYITVINKTNLTIKNNVGESMTSLLAKRDVLKSQIDILRNAFDQATSTSSRYSRGEIKYVSAVDVISLRDKIDGLSKKYRELDMEIQTLNFSSELIELVDNEADDVLDLLDV